jgi:4-diphosphocytidyl-2-C-methyl-D-erythritol kinase
MAPIDLADDVRVAPLEGDGPSRYTIVLAPDAPRKYAIDWPIEKDLAVRAHRLLEQEAGRALPVDLQIRKRIPVGGGLGGGSSDAGAALLAIREAFGLDIPHRRLVELGATLGSDVPYFLDDAGGAPGRTRGAPRAAIVSGLGDQIERVTTPREPVLLLIPPFGCPTGPVYKAYDAAGPGSLREREVRALVSTAERQSRIPAADLFNDLGGPACRVEPRLGALLQLLHSADVGPVHMTGSGSTLFVLLKSERRDAAATSERIRTLVPPDVVLVESRII